MNGAEALVHTMVAGGVEICFANPGTSEMHFVVALDRIPGVRCVLGLFEGVVTGAADGYARMADKPAATLLHTGPGLANGLANLHNARKAYSPIVNIVGEHATYHIKHDAPLTTDIEALARPMSHWVRTTPNADAVASDAAAAIAAARTAPGQIATLILPADAAWSETGKPLPAVAAPPPRPHVTEAGIRASVAALRSGKPTLLLLSGVALRAPALALAGRIAAATGARLSAQMSNGRVERGAGRVAIARVPYPVDSALATLKDFANCILIGAKPPVAFFGYPGKPSALLPEGCNVVKLAAPGDDLLHALEWLAAEVGAHNAVPEVAAPNRPGLPQGALDPDSLMQAVGALLPENAIICDESITTGRRLFSFTDGAPPHDFLQVTGGSIGLGMPLATGAAIACPDRKVLSLEADGSGMYTLQALWTQARENLDVTTVVCANRSYAILHHEMQGVRAGAPGPRARDMLSLDRPALDWVAMARGMGVEGARATTADELVTHLKAGLGRKGPFLIEAVL
jgi:acetolactate synthase-1/2/3 large subunit